MKETIELHYLTRVEGEGGLKIILKGDVLQKVELRIFEAPRFFEEILKGRHFREAPDVTARICGICPVAYQMTAVQAMEMAFNISVSEGIRKLRHLLYCGEWISSHALHIHFLHAPDFFGLPDGVSLAKLQRKAIERGLFLKNIGQQIMKTIVGREMHGINVQVGGFYSLPSSPEIQGLIEPLKKALDLSIETAQWTARFPFPECQICYELVALRHAKEYPMLAGDIRSSSGLKFGGAQFDDFFAESQVSYSTAAQWLLKRDKVYLTGPLARYFHNFDRLSTTAQQTAQMVNLKPSDLNPYKSIVIRSLEMIHACEQALELVLTYQQPDRAFTSQERISYGGQCFAVTEAPRGVLYHRYSIGANGFVEGAKLVPPTAQNQKALESALEWIVRKHLTCGEQILIRECERMIRNFDPCISCATHFLKLDIERNF